MKKVLIIGAGITGIMAKYLIPEAILLEEKANSSDIPRFEISYLDKRILMFKTRNFDVTL